VLFSKRHLPKSALATALDPTPVLAAGLGPLAHPSRSDNPPPFCSLRRGDSGL